MNYCLFRMHFQSAFHIGSSRGGASLASSEMQIHSDTLFSALCIEALQAGGQDELDRLYGLVKDEKLCFSDAFPFCGDELYVPKPIISVPAKGIIRENDDAKKIKKLIYLPVTEFDAYLAYLKGDTSVDFNSLPENIQFGITSIREMASIHGKEQAEPFAAGTFEFLHNCGLYLIVAYDTAEELSFFKKLMNLLSLSGIGGKRTAGMGNFILEDEAHLESPSAKAQECLYKLLTYDEAPWHMTLNVSIPDDSELDEIIEEGFYKVERRGGFVQSQSYAQTPLKKQAVYLFAAGSCMKKRYSGDILDVSINGTHPVYRMAKPLFMGVDI